MLEGCNPLLCRLISCSFPRWILFLVMVVLALQGLHLLLLAKLQEEGMKGALKEAKSHWESNEEQLKVLFHHSTQGGVLDWSGEFRVVSKLLLSSAPLTKDLVLATHSSIGHLHHLPLQAERWQGPLSVSVFSSGSELTETLQLLLSLRRCNAAVRDNCTFHLITPFPLNSPQTSLNVPDEQHITCQQVQENVLSKYTSIPLAYSSGNSQYPGNLLRNVAIRHAASKYILMLDIDLVPSKGIRDGFLRIKEKSSMNDKTAYVLPSYEIRSSEGSAPKDKSQLQRLIREGNARPFYADVCWKCQAVTDNARWEQLGDSFSFGYEVLWKDPWEPFFIAPSSMPLYDERFRQYGFNRISQVCELHVSGFSFHVLQGVFVSHIGWKTSTSFHSSRHKEQEYNRQLFRLFKSQLKERYPLSSRRCY